MTPREIAVKALDQARAIAMQKVFVDATDEIEEAVKSLIDAAARQETEELRAALRGLLSAWDAYMEGASLPKITPAVYKARAALGNE